MFSALLMAYSNTKTLTSTLTITLFSNTNPNFDRNPKFLDVSMLLPLFCNVAPSPWKTVEIFPAFYGRGIFTVQLHVVQRTVLRRHFCLSVCLTHALWQNKRNVCPHSFTTWKIIYLSFLTRRMVGEGLPLVPEIFETLQPAPRLNARNWWSRDFVYSTDLWRLQIYARWDLFILFIHRF